MQLFNSVCAWICVQWFSWEINIPHTRKISFPILPQISNTFLKKQRDVSKGYRSVSLQFTLSCLRAQVLVVDITYFAISELDLIGKWLFSFYKLGS